MTNLDIISIENYRIIKESNDNKNAGYYIEVKVRNRLGEPSWIPTDKHLQPSFSGHRYTFGDKTELPIQIIYELIRESTQTDTK